MSEHVFPVNRICPHCPATFEKWQIDEHVEHMRQHGFSPAQWTTAYERIQEGKERAKQAAKDRS
jgi:hypothetical protein